MLPAMQRMSLHDAAWSVRWVAGPDDTPAAVREAGEIPAMVPGCIHTDLMAAGLLDDPYVGDNELKQFWVGRSDWTYTCRFDVLADVLDAPRMELACDGLDTIATVMINRGVSYRADNMHRRWRFDAKQYLTAGANEIRIGFAAPLVHVERMARLRGELPHVGNGANEPHPHNEIRKMACNFGWDWGPDVPTVGVWRPIRLDAFTTRIAGVRPLVMKATADEAVVRVHVDVDGDAEATATLTAPDGATFEPTRDGDAFVFTVANPQRWWPVGHGEQPLYELSVKAGADDWTHKIGLRTTRLLVDADAEPVGAPVPDAKGERMTLYVNEVPVYAKGANWIPDDCFPHRVTPQRYRDRITKARDANMNLLRVWGGGLYESDDFYDICDELGVMVWQDFTLACAAYHEEEPVWSSVEAEARDNISRLSRHPSLVIWNGCNENFMGVWDWSDDWRRLRKDHMTTWGLGYYLSLFPKLMKELDPSRPYWPGSPYSGSFERPANLNEFGNRHIWDVWHGPGQYRNYLAHYPRMSTEFGFHGPPTWPTLERSIPEDQRYWNSPLMRLHNKNGGPGRDGQEQSTTRMADDFEPPLGKDQFDDWLYLSQVMQARALEMGVTWFRALHPWNSGAVYWQFNDCYPVASWSALDGDGRKKPLWYATRRFLAPRLVTIKPRRTVGKDGVIGKLAVYLHNDHGETWAGTYVVRQMAFDGRKFARHEQVVSIEPRGSSRFEIPDAMHDADSFLVAELDGGERGYWWFRPDKEIAYPAADFDAEIAETPDGLSLTIQAKTLLRDLCVFPDRLDPAAEASDQCVTLLPGESATIDIRTTSQLSLAALTAAPALNVANRFGKR